MSMKVRAYYRIKGDALCQRLAEYYAENVQRKKEVEEEWLELTPLLGNKWEGKLEIAGSKLDPATGVWVDYYRPAEVWLLLANPIIVKDREITFHAQSKWSPPIEALQILSGLYPEGEIELSYSTESYHWSDRTKLRLRQGEVILTGYQDFLLAEKDEPVHHWLVSGPPEAIAALKKANICVYTPSVGSYHSDNDTSFRYKVPDSEIAKAKAIPGLKCTPFTLDEANFFQQFEYYPGEDTPPHALAGYVRLLERPVALTEEEVAVVKRLTAEANEEAARSFFQEHPHLTKSEEDRRWGAKAARIASHPEVARYDFYPTAREIKLLLPLASPDRRKQLEDALLQPAWQRNWPEWEIVELEKDKEPLARVTREEAWLLWDAAAKRVRNEKAPQRVLLWPLEKLLNRLTAFFFGEADTCELYEEKEVELVLPLLSPERRAEVQTAIESRKHVGRQRLLGDAQGSTV